jgi:nicotinamidase-related amidase
MKHPKILDISQTALVVIDLQEAFRSAIPEFPQVASRAAMAVRGFQTLNVPTIVTRKAWDARRKRFCFASRTITNRSKKQVSVRASIRFSRN